MLSDEAVVRRLEQLIVRTLNIEPPERRVDLIDGGVLDSLGLVELLGAIEQEFAIRIPLDDFDIERFRTIERLAQFVRECEGHPPEASVDDSAM
jgi:D-alanine--poly(phosphoribitol) ligase subunit 2